MLTLFVLCLLSQDLQQTPVTGLEPLNAIVFTKDGDQLELVGIRLRGVDPYQFMLSADQRARPVNIYEVAKVSSAREHGKFEVLLQTGETLTGRIQEMTLEARAAPGLTTAPTIYLHQLEKLVVLCGRQPRSCPNGDYENYTARVTCPRCGLPLDLGFYNDYEPGTPKPVQPFHRLRLDGRNPSRQ